jgi:two-component system LytT family response regulator
VSTGIVNTHPALEIQPGIIVEGESRSRETVAPADKRNMAPPQSSGQWEPRGSRTGRIAIKTNGRILFIDAADVIAVEAEGNYVLLHHKTSAHLLRESISIAEAKLSSWGLVRIHRSVLVNARKIEEIRRVSTGEYVLRLTNGREYTVTRTYRRNLRFVSPMCLGGEL